MPVGEFGNVESDVEVPASEGWARLRGMLEDDVAMPRFDERVPSGRHWDMPMQCVFLEAGLVRHGPTHGRLARIWLFFGSWVTSARLRASRSGGR